MGQVLWLLLPTRETQMEFLLSGFALAQLQLLQAFGHEPVGARSVSLLALPFT